MHYHHILCPVDFSSASRAALATASDLAARYDAELTLVHVYPTPGYPLADGFLPAPPETLLRVDEAARVALKEWAEAAGAMGARRVSSHLAMGHAATEVLRCCHEMKPDLIVLGTHGHSLLGGALLGSVADRVIRAANCAVMSVPAPDKT